MADDLVGKLQDIAKERDIEIERIASSYTERCDVLVSEYFSRVAGEIINRSRDYSKALGGKKVFEPLEVLVAGVKIIDAKRELLALVVPARYGSIAGKPDDFLPNQLKAIVLQTCYDFGRPERVSNIEFAHWAVPFQSWDHITKVLASYAEHHKVLNSANVRIKPVYIDSIHHLKYSAAEPASEPAEQLEEVSSAEDKLLTGEDFARRWGYNQAGAQAQITSGVWFGKDVLKFVTKKGKKVAAVPESVVQLYITGGFWKPKEKVN